MLARSQQVQVQRSSVDKDRQFFRANSIVPQLFVQILKSPCLANLRIFQKADILPNFTLACIFQKMLQKID